MVDAWFINQVAATAKYGPIEDWDTSEVIDMSNLFFGAESFNENISMWITSKVTTMHSSTSTLPFIFSSVGLDLFSHLDFFYLFFSIFCLF